MNFEATALLIMGLIRVIVDPTIADAVLDRIVHTTHRLALDAALLSA